MLGGAPLGRSFMNFKGLQKQRYAPFHPTVCLGVSLGMGHQSVTHPGGKGIGTSGPRDSRRIPKVARKSHKTLRRSAENTQNMNDAAAASLKKAARPPAPQRPCPLGHHQNTPSPADESSL